MSVDRDHGTPVASAALRDAPGTRNVTYCRRCIMHDGLPGVTIDRDGVCSNCEAFDEILARYPAPDAGLASLSHTIGAIKRAGSNRPYDCVVGLSGGTDSTYTLYRAYRLGLRPLAVHFDNGWNTAVAVHNIKVTLERLQLDLWTYVVDWEEFKDLQLSFLKASVPSVEMPTDLAIWSVLFQTAARFGIRHILSGNCFRAEGVVPHAWGFKDARLVRGIQSRFGTRRLDSFPNLPLTRYAWYSLGRRIRLVRLLNYLDYSKDEAKATLARELDWIDYGGHHHESIYTRFFQSFLARQKFNMDRRSVGLSARVRLGKISREEAFERLQEDDYTAFLQEDDRKYVAKKLGVQLRELDAIIAQPPASDLDFPSYYPLLRRIQRLIRFARRFNILAGAFQTGRFS